MESSATVAVDPTGEFIRMTLKGPMTDALATECSRKMRSMPEFAAGMPVLLDLRHIASFDMTTDAVVGFAQGAQNDVNRFAILAPLPVAFGMARMYEMISDLTESRVGVYQEEAPALQWLQD